VPSPSQVQPPAQRQLLDPLAVHPENFFMISCFQSIGSKVIILKPDPVLEGKFGVGAFLNCQHQVSIETTGLGKSFYDRAYDRVAFVK